MEALVVCGYTILVCVTGRGARLLPCPSSLSLSLLFLFLDSNDFSFFPLSYIFFVLSFP